MICVPDNAFSHLLVALGGVEYSMRCRSPFATSHSDGKPDMVINHPVNSSQDIHIRKEICIKYENLIIRNLFIDLDDGRIH